MKLSRVMKSEEKANSNNVRVGFIIFGLVLPVYIFNGHHLKPLVTFSANNTI